MARFTKHAEIVNSDDDTIVNSEFTIVNWVETHFRALLKHLSYTDGDRLTASKEIGIKELPANVYEGITSDEAVAISYNNNQNQQTFKPETFMDMAYQIHRIHKDGKSLEVIGGILGMTMQNVGYYNAIVNKLAPDILVLIESHISNGFSNLLENNQSSLFEENSNTFEKIDWKFN